MTSRYADEIEANTEQEAKQAIGAASEFVKAIQGLLDQAREHSA
jgi:hypothetical protein